MPRCDPDGESVVLKKYMHIGFAADTPNGLLVPVIRERGQAGHVTASRAHWRDLSDRARKGTLKGSEMQGGCFTISSLGGIGGTAFTPIINAPEVAILGVSRTQTRPVWQDGEFVPRQMLPLSLSYDHRLIDGALGARFAVYLSKVLADPAALLGASACERTPGPSASWWCWAPDPAATPLRSAPPTSACRWC